MFVTEALPPTQGRHLGATLARSYLILQWTFRSDNAYGIKRFLAILLHIRYSTIDTHADFEVLQGVLHPEAHGNRFQKKKNSCGRCQRGAMDHGGRSCARGGGLLFVGVKA